MKKAVFAVLLCIAFITVDASVSFALEKGEKIKVAAPRDRADAFLTTFASDYKIEDKPAKTTTPLFVFGRMIFFTALILLGLFILLKWLVGKKKWITGESQYLSLLTTLPIAPNRYIGIVDIAGDLVVIGITEHSIGTIYEIKDKDKADMIRFNFQQKQNSLNFLQTLKNRFGVQINEDDVHKDKNRGAIIGIVNEETEHLRRMQNDMETL